MAGVRAVKPLCPGRLRAGNATCARGTLPNANDRQPDSTPERSGEELIDERLLDHQQEGRPSVVDAAADAFAADQRSPDHPSRVERSHSADDPSHSVASPRHGAREGDFNR